MSHSSLSSVNPALFSCYSNPVWKLQRELYIPWSERRIRRLSLFLITLKLNKKYLASGIFAFNIFYRIGTMKIGKITLALARELSVIFAIPHSHLYNNNIKKYGKSYSFKIFPFNAECHRTVNIFSFNFTRINGHKNLSKKRSITFWLFLVDIFVSQLLRSLTWECWLKEIDCRVALCTIFSTINL